MTGAFRREAHTGHCGIIMVTIHVVDITVGRVIIGVVERKPISGLVAFILILLVQHCRMEQKTHPGTHGKIEKSRSQAPDGETHHRLGASTGNFRPRVGNAAKLTKDDPNFRDRLQESGLMATRTSRGVH